jgi:hypothetical protein
MNTTFNVITPRCGICKKFYSSKDDDDSGLCPKCRPIDSRPLINKPELNIEDIIEPGPYGVSNTQMIPAMKKAIQEESLEKLRLLQKIYFYTFHKSIRYLNKREREYINNHLMHH